MLYNLAISLYKSAVKVAALFSSKPARMLEGQNKAFIYLLNNLDPYDKHLWVHAASLGEFEQGRPLIERLRKDYPKYKIVLTFFSPSGYEVRKDYKGADYVCYLPFDTTYNAMMFVKIVNPMAAFFIKYEFWRNYLRELNRNGVPAYSISSIFRPNQIFFRWYGGSYREVLHSFDHFFVQNEESKKLLYKAKVGFSTVVGDTRFDRVLDIKAEAQQLPLVECFKGDAPTLVVGSSWRPDEDIIISYFNAHPEMKLIIAPHVVNDSHLMEIEAKLTRPFARYSQASEVSVHQADCLVIDCYGLLSSIYRYGDIAYVGGGFGVGIHNVLEAAVYGIPVIFGPKNKKFREARQLMELKGGFEITSSNDFVVLMDRFLSDSTYLQASGKAAGDYVKNNSGALDKIMEYLEL